jgi:hypothetical protein
MMTMLIICFSGLHTSSCIFEFIATVDGQLGSRLHVLQKVINCENATDWGMSIN